MSTTGEAAVSYSSLPDLAMCDECESKSRRPEVFCLKCKLPFCSPCDTEVVHTSKATRKHDRMKIDEFLVVEHGLGGSTLTDDQLQADAENKLFYISPIDQRIHVQPRLASLVTNPNARPSLVTFIGPTGAGKSTFLRLLVSMDGERDAGRLPLASARNESQSTSADVHIYGAQSDNSRYPLLYVDSEGRGGARELLATRNMLKYFNNQFLDKSSWNPKSFSENRYKHVQVSYPRMLYIFSDVLCFVFQGDLREVDTIVNPLSEWGKSAAVGAANQHRPQLIIIINKTGSIAKEPEYDDFRSTYQKWICNHEDYKDELEKYYLDPLVFLIPDRDISAALVFDRVKKLRSEILCSTQVIRNSRAQANQLFNRRQLHFYMQLAADTFSENPNGKFDIYQACIAREPTPNILAGYIVEFRRVIDQANSEDRSKSERYRKSLKVLKKRIKQSVLLWISRQNEHLPVGPKAQLPKPLEKELEKAQEVIAVCCRQP